MPDTGAPYFIPFADPTDLVRDWPALSEDVAEQVALGLDAAGGLVAVKSAIFTGTQTNATAAGANFAVTDLSITHEVADASNKLIISAFLGAVGASGAQSEGCLAVAVDGTLIAVGDSPGSRTAVTAGGQVKVNTTGDLAATVTSMPAATFVYVPGAGSKTYTVRAVNMGTATNTIFVNRQESDTDSGDRTRAVSSLVIQEVKV